MKKLFLFLSSLPFFAYAQDGTLDTGFNFPTTISTVNANNIAEYANGDVILAGNMKINNVNRSIAKFNSSGALIASYPLKNVWNLAGTSIASITAMVKQPDDKIIIVGVFERYDNLTQFSNGNLINGLIRINTDGTLDQTFAPNLSFVDALNAGATLGATKIVLNANGDVFVNYRIQTRTDGTHDSFSILKISSTGVVDATFKSNAPVLTNSPVLGGRIFSDLDLQSDGKIIAVGSFANYDFNGTTYDNVIRLNTNGTLDTTFSNVNNFLYESYGYFYDANMYNIDVLNDDSIFVSGNFTSLNGTTVNNYAKLKPNGIHDVTYNSNVDLGTYKIVPTSYKIIEDQADLKMIIVAKDETARKVKLMRLHKDGSIDTCFSELAFGYSNSSSPTIYDVHVCQNDKIFVSGMYNQVDKFSKSLVVRLNNNLINIVSNNDTFSADGCLGATSTQVVYSNDTMEGTPIPSPLNDMTVLQVGGVTPTPSNGGISINPNGTVTVQQGTPDGTYTLYYQLTTIACPVSGNVAAVTVNVTSSGTVMAFSGINDSNIYTTQGTTSTQSLFDGVLLGGAPANSSSVMITNLNFINPHPGITVNNDGTFTVAANVPNGEYRFYYTLCQRCVPGNCANSVKGHIWVGLIAWPDSIGFKTNGVVTDSHENVLFNDRLVNTPIYPSNPPLVSISYQSNIYFDIETNPSSPDFGKIIPKPGPFARIGVEIPYTICLVGNPAYCHTSKLNVSVYDIYNRVSDISSVEVLNEINVFPNPSEGVFTIDLHSGGSTKVDVYNVLGQLVFTKEVSKENNQIDLSSFKQGAYLLKLKNGDKIFNKKVLKK